jgi:hypothetical protein
LSVLQNYNKNSISVYFLPYYLQQPVEEKISPAEEKEEVQETEEAAHLSELSLLTSMSSRWKEKTPLFPVKVR